MEKSGLANGADHQPSSTTGPGSLQVHGQTTGGPGHHQVTPPPYSGPSALEAHPDGPHDEQDVSPQQRTFPVYADLPRIDYRVYSPPLFKLSSDLTTLSTKAEYLSSNANALLTLIRTQASVPPKPVIRIRGSRHGVVDFDLRLNLLSLLVPIDEKHQLNFVQCVANGELAHRGGLKPDVKPDVGAAGLEQWCHLFAQDDASIKVFTLERIVVNLDFNWIEGQIRSLLASLSYKGVVDVDLVTTHSKVMIQNPDKVNQFFTSIAGMFTGKHKYEVVRSVWPFATAPKGRPGRRCTSQSEEAWWREWKDSVKYAIAQRRQGWVTIEDKLEVMMEGKGATASVDWIANSEM